jgi:hypothetical protein
MTVRLIYDELRSPTIDEKLMLALTLSRAGDRRASRFLARWHASYVARSKLSLEQTAALLHALRLLPDTNPLEDVLDQLEETACLAELRWLVRGQE